MLKLLWSSVFIVCIKLAIPTTYGFDQNQPNLGSGMNFYREIPDPTVKRRPEVLIIDPYDCSGFSDDGSDSCDIPDFCCKGAEPIDCDFSSPYRNYDGSCNNPYIPSLGMRKMCFPRLTPAYYEGDGGIRKSVTGGPLPGPREISVNIFTDVHQPSPTSYWFTGWGQGIAHDLSQAVQPPMRSACCKPETEKDPNCLPISVRPDDPFFSKFNQDCLNFVRSEECTSCETGSREQANYATATIDAGIVYGGTKEKAMDLRANDGTGKLKSSSWDEGYLLPAGKDENDPFCPRGQDPICFKAGDPRCNMHTTLTSVHTILMREHNRIAHNLKILNPHWDGETLYQESRKIVIAEHQCITYKEYLPILLGYGIVEAFDLSVKKGRKGTIYNPNIFLGTFQECALGSFRIHSMVPTCIGVENVTFKDTYKNPSMIRQGYIPDIVKGSFYAPSESEDLWVVEDLTNYLFKDPGAAFGTDLAAIDIQRGRDHGASPYVKVVEFCSGGTIIITCFEDLKKYSLMSDENIKLLEDNYDYVEDVDLWVGMRLEWHYPGSQLGPASTCVNVIQFYATQKGDRFYFDHKGPDASFTDAQRSAIKQCSMARILCDNTEITVITPEPFLLPSYKNPFVTCNSIPGIDLSPWKESPSEDDCDLFSISIEL